MHTSSPSGASGGKGRPLFLLLLLCLAFATPSEGQSRTIVRIDLDDIVQPISAGYVRDGLEYASSSGAAAVLLRIDTPGGLMDSMREVVESILNSPVPVITWVGPSGARAASAGFFILLAGDVALMAPGTNTGAAHPVAAAGGDLQETMEKKVISDASAFLRSFVSRRDRNTAAAESAVTESRSFTAEEAERENLIDGILGDVPAIVAGWDGREIRRLDGTATRLRLAGAGVTALEMTGRQKVLSTVLNPNVALVLGLLGLLGLYIEVTHPGLLIPGVGGGICLVLSLFAFNLLPVNWTGAALILLALVLFVLEATVVSHGILALGGIVAMLCGAVMLVEGPIPELRVQIVTALAVTLPVAAITVFLVRLVFLSYRTKTRGDDSGLLGEIGVARSDIAGDGTVFVHGELWKAFSSSPIEAGASVQVIRTDGLRVEVKKINN